MFQSTIGEPEQMVELIILDHFGPDLRLRTSLVVSSSKAEDQLLRRVDGTIGQLFGYSDCVDDWPYKQSDPFDCSIRPSGLEGFGTRGPRWRSVLFNPPHAKRSGVRFSSFFLN